MKIKHGMILAAGLGKRMQPITLKTPKPLIQIGNKNLLERAIELLINHGIEEIAINVHHLPDQIKDFINSKKYKAKIIISDEQDMLLDTGGGILHATRSFKKPFVAVNPDTLWSDAYFNELKDLAAFAERHDLIIVSDEIHNDLIMPGNKHIPMAIAAPEIMNRLVMMTATTKTFNIAGMHTGNVIIPDSNLRAEFSKTMMAYGITPNSFGKHMVTAAYSQEGAAWVDSLMIYLAENQRIFNREITKIPGINPMTLEGTYLGWVDFTNTGMSPKEFTDRVEKSAQIVANHGHTFGTGGEYFLRFNIATRRSLVLEALDRLTNAFSDLQ